MMVVKKKRGYQNSGATTPFIYVLRPARPPPPSRPHKTLKSTAQNAHKPPNQPTIGASCGLTHPPPKRLSAPFLRKQQPSSWSALSALSKLRGARLASSRIRPKGAATAKEGRRDGGGGESTKIPATAFLHHVTAAQKEGKPRGKSKRESVRAYREGLGLAVGRWQRLASSPEFRRREGIEAREAPGSPSNHLQMP